MNDETNKKFLELIQAKKEQMLKRVMRYEELKCNRLFFDEEKANKFINKVRREIKIETKWQDYSANVQLKKNETIAVSSRPLTAMLFFDRVWDAHRTIPEISFFAGTPQEQLFQIGMALIDLQERGNSKGFKPEDAFDLLGLELGYGPFGPVDFWGQFVEIITKAASDRCNLAITPVYESTEKFKGSYQEGNTNVLIASIENLEIIDNEKLELEQVLEFRKDTESKKKLKVLTHWLDDKMVGKSPKFIEEEISKKLYQYEWAIKKHGLKTITGNIRSFLNSKFLINASAMSGVTYYATNDQLSSLLAMGALMVGKCVVSITDILVDLKDVKSGPHSEVAYVHELKKKL